MFKSLPAGLILLSLSLLLGNQFVMWLAPARPNSSRLGQHRPTVATHDPTPTGLAFQEPASSLVVKLVTQEPAKVDSSKADSTDLAPLPVNQDHEAVTPETTDETAAARSEAIPKSEPQVDALAIAGNKGGLGRATITFVTPEDVTPAARSIRLEEADGRLFYIATRSTTQAVRDTDTKTTGDDEVRTGSDPPEAATPDSPDASAADSSEPTEAATGDPPPSSQLVTTTFWFLFQGSEPLELQFTAWDPAWSHETQVTPQADRDQWFALLYDWSEAYGVAAESEVDEHRWLRHELAEMLRRRFVAPALQVRRDQLRQQTSSDPVAAAEWSRLESIERALGRTQRSPTDGESSLERQFETALQRVLGFDSVTTALGNQLFETCSLFTEARDATTPARGPLPTVQGIPPVDVPPANGSVSIEPLAYQVPDNCYYVRFGSLTQLQWTRQLLDGWGGNLHDIVVSPTRNRRLREKIEKQLLFSLDLAQTYRLDETIRDVALIGTDIWFERGATVGAVFEVDQPDAFQERLRQMRTELLVGETAQAKTSDFAGYPLESWQTPDHRIRSFWAERDGFAIVTNSEVLAQRFLSLQPHDSLGQLNEYRYARDGMGALNTAETLVYLSDPFFRQLIAPDYQLEYLRRERADLELRQIVVAQQVARGEGIATPSLKTLERLKMLPPQFGQRPDDSHVVFRDGEWLDSVRGRAGTFLPALDHLARQANPKETQLYGQFAERYRREWQRVDPVIASIQPDQRQPRRVGLQCLITPFSRSHYAGLANLLDGQRTREIQIEDDDLLTLQAQVRNGTQSRPLKFAIKDDAVEFTIRNGQVVAADPFGGNTFARRNAYVLTTPADGQSLPMIARFLGQLFPEEGAALQTASTPPRRSRGFNPLMLLIDVSLRQLPRIARMVAVETQDNWKVVSLRPAIRDRAFAQRHVRDLNTSGPPFRVHLADLRHAQVAPYLRASAYLQERRLSDSQVAWFEFARQQLRLDREQTIDFLEALHDAEILCPLGGEWAFASAMPEPQWISTAWQSPVLADERQIPDGYEFPFFDWLESLDIGMGLNRTTLTVTGELMLREPHPAPDSAIPDLGLPLPPATDDQPRSSDQ